MRVGSFVWVEERPTSVGRKSRRSGRCALRFASLCAGFEPCPSIGLVMKMFEFQTPGSADGIVFASRSFFENDLSKGLSFDEAGATWVRKADLRLT